LPRPGTRPPMISSCSNPNGYSTVIGDKVVCFLGANNNSFSIARALLKNAPVLLLDEAMVSGSIERTRDSACPLKASPKAERLLLFAHRLSPVSKADQIVVIGSEVRSDKLVLIASFWTPDGVSRLYDLAIQCPSCRNSRE